MKKIIRRGEMEEGCLYAIIAAVIIFFGIGFAWYKASRQADMYHKQNIQISTWDCFIGVTPAEKVVQIK